MATIVLVAWPAAAASADTHYGGSAVYKAKQLAGPSVSVVRRDNGRILARLALGYRCGRITTSSVVVRLSGTSNGASFTASGRTRWAGIGTMRFTMTGTLTGDSGTARARLRTRRGCPDIRYHPIALRTQSAPAGAPVTPARGSLFFGLTGQTVSGARLPVSVRVANNGRVYAHWQAGMSCRGRGTTIPVLNVTPTTRVRADGSFSRSETYTIRFTDGYSERYRVNFSGRFLADGVVGTLRARMQGRKPGRRYVPCASGTQTWAARP